MTEATRPRPEIALRPTAGSRRRPRDARQPYSCPRPADQADFRDLLFTENETQQRASLRRAQSPALVKDAFHEAVIHGRTEAVNPAGQGTKAAAIT